MFLFTEYNLKNKVKGVFSISVTKKPLNLFYAEIVETHRTPIFFILPLPIFRKASIPLSIMS